MQQAPLCRSGRAMSAACTARPSTGDTMARSSGCSTPAPPRRRIDPPQYCAKAVSVAQRGAYLGGHFGFHQACAGLPLHNLSRPTAAPCCGMCLNSLLKA